MRYSFDPAKNAANLLKHGVPLSEADGVLSDPLAVTAEDFSADDERRWVTIGQNVWGELRLVVWTLGRMRFGSYPCANRLLVSEEHMKKEYDFSKGKRGAVLPSKGKTRITIFLDDAIIEHFRVESERTGKGYQTLINAALAAHISGDEKPLTASAARRILREMMERK